MTFYELSTILRDICSTDGSREKKAIKSLWGAKMVRRVDNYYFK